MASREIGPLPRRRESALALGCLIRIFMTEEQSPQIGWVGGLSLAFGIWIGPEFLLFTALYFSAFGLRWIALADARATYAHFVTESLADADLVNASGAPGSHRVLMFSNDPSHWPIFFTGVMSICISFGPLISFLMIYQDPCRRNQFCLEHELTALHVLFLLTWHSSMQHASYL